MIVLLGAVKAFEKLVSREDLPKIEKMLKDEDSDVREAAVKAFEKLVTQKDLPKDAWNVRKATIKSFEKLGSRGVFWIPSDGLPTKIERPPI
jgi:HEAT repeat protein